MRPVGNCAAGSYGPVNVDLTAPTVSPVVSPAPNAQGWANQPPTVTYSCADALSGVASCPTPVAISAEGANQTVTGTAVDTAGNTAHTTVSINL